MRTTFLGYYRFTEEEFSTLWKDCLFVLDANVILNLYRYSKNTSDVLLNILKGISERLWLPLKWVPLSRPQNRKNKKSLVDIKLNSSTKVDFSRCPIIEALMKATMVIELEVVRQASVQI